MSTFNVSKVLSSLPDPLVADTEYFVRKGAGFDHHIVDSSGQIAYKVNAPLPAVTTLSESDYAALTTTEQDDDTKLYVVFPDA